MIDGAGDTALTRVAVGPTPLLPAHCPRYNRVYVANENSASISVLRDSGGGIEEGPKPQATSSKPAATVVRGLPPGVVVFDAMGRRTTNPGPGVYFVREQSAFSSQYSGRSAVGARKVVLQR